MRNLKKNQPSNQKRISKKRNNLKSVWKLGVAAALILSACSAETRGEIPVTTIPGSPALMASGTSSSTIDKKPSTPDLIPSAEPSLSPATTAEPCLEEHGKLQAFSIAKRGQEITGQIYTPPCYGDNQEQRYPSLYLLHGATETDQQWGELGLFDLADELISSGEIPPLIIILPREKSWIPLPDNPFGEQLIKDLLPWVDGEYQTLAASEYRAIGGLSRGGNWAVRLGLLYWGQFGSIGAHSTPLFIGDLERIPEWIGSIPVSKTPRIYLDIGGDDNDLSQASAFEEELIRLEIPHTWHLFPGTHNESYWQDHLAEYLLWYSSGWRDMD